MAPRIAILASFVLSSTLGGVFVAGYWMHQGRNQRAAASTVLFVAVMVFVHLLGYRVWLSQPVRYASAPMYQRVNARVILGVLLFGVCLFLSGVSFRQYLEVRRQAAERMAAGQPFAPTMISEPAGWAVAFLCFAVISLLAGLKRTPLKLTKDNTPG
jgi:hypothetical protein